MIDLETRSNIVDYEISKHKMKNISSEEIEKDIEKKNSLDFAGVFAVQQLGTILIENIDGDYSNIVGMPLFKLNEMFIELECDIYEYN